MRYQSKRPKRQFLAGVSCPKCQKTDVIVQVQIFEPKFDEFIQCTVCDHSECRPSAQDITVIHGESSNVSIVKFR